MTTFGLAAFHLGGWSIRNASADVLTSPWLHVFMVNTGVTFCALVSAGGAAFGVLLAGEGGGVAFGVGSLLVTEKTMSVGFGCFCTPGSFFEAAGFDAVFVVTVN